MSRQIYMENDCIIIDDGENRHVIETTRIDETGAVIKLPPIDIDVEIEKASKKNHQPNLRVKV